MELFERIYHLKFLAGSLQAVAEALGIAPQKISAYSNEKSQKNFYPFLPNLLRAYPQINRDWLYFGEGPILIDSEDSSAEVLPSFFEAKIQKLRDVNAHLAEANQKLLEQNQKLIEQNHELIDKLLKLSLKGE